VGSIKNLQSKTVTNRGNKEEITERIEKQKNVSN
jgi:hypothetical protein